MLFASPRCACTRLQVECHHRRHRQPAVPAVTRRDLIGALAVVLTWPATGAAAADPPLSISAAEPFREPVGADSAAQLTDRAASNLAAGTSGRAGTVFSTNDFSLVMPAGFVDKQPPPPLGAGFGDQPIRSTLGQPKESPLKARWETADGRESVSVIVRASADIKPTFLQITDITQFGTPQQVASLVLPRDVRLLGTAVTKTPLPPKDTGTVLGIVERDPITTYRYEFVTRNQHVVMAVASKLGKVFMAAGATDEARYPDAAAQLNAAVDSFQLVM